MKRIYAKRWHALSAALDTNLPGWKRQTKFGRSSFWLEGPVGFSAIRLAQEALAVGVVVEPGKALFHDDQPNDRFFRLGSSSIAEERIRPGILSLRNAVSAHALTPGRPARPASLQNERTLLHSTDVGRPRYSQHHVAEATGSKLHARLSAV